jgi:hypothetical protein
MNRSLFACAVFIGGAALLFAADVKIDYSHSADFGQYHTYSWLKADAQDPLWIDRIQRGVDAQLTAKGWMKVEQGGDTGITAIGATHNEQTLQTFYDGFGGGWSWRGGGDIATTTVEKTPVGTLMVDVFDTHTKKLVWRGTASNVLSDKPENNEKKLEKSLHDMFKNFPPRPKG